MLKIFMIPKDSKNNRDIRSVNVITRKVKFMRICR